MRWPARSNAASGTSTMSGTSSAAAGDGSRMPSGPQHQPVVRRPGAKHQRLAARQRSPAAPAARPARQALASAARDRSRCGSANSPTTMHAGRDRERQAARGRWLRRSSALLVAQRIALRAAQRSRSSAFDRSIVGITHRTIQRSVRAARSNRLRITASDRAQTRKVRSRDGR